MRLLVDSNIVLEILLVQQRAEEAQTLLAQTEEHDFCISDFAFHSIGVYLCRRGFHPLFQNFLDDMIFNDALTILDLTPYNIERVIRCIKKFKLDFDDAYQYALAEKHGLTILSFDRDFDRTERGRKTPAEILG